MRRCVTKSVVNSIPFRLKDAIIHRLSSTHKAGAHLMKSISHHFLVSLSALLITRLKRLFAHIKTPPTNHKECLSTG
jgi:hypothetical protein